MRGAMTRTVFVMLAMAMGAAAAGRTVIAHQGKPATTAPAAAAAPQKPETKAAAPDAAAVSRGQAVYTKVGCYQCHGREGQGSSFSGPRVGPNPLPLAAFIAYVRTPAADMPPYTAQVISDKDLTDVHAFLAARAPATRVTIP